MGARHEQRGAGDCVADIEQDKSKRAVVDLEIQATGRWPSVKHRDVLHHMIGRCL
jgi:hypothetical protein